MATGHLGNALRQLRQLLGNSTAGEQTDGQLLESFRVRQDAAAFETLVKRHAPMVLGVCRRILKDGHDAEDAFQATFLVLVKKARSIGKADSVGCWLYRVAYHLALRARSSGERRKSQERQVEAMNAVSPGDSTWDDLRPVLDEEINRLPEKYRAPMVLCYFEGKTNEEAAQALQWPTGTVQGRLARAREMLRQRLTRRGLALTSVALAAALTECAASASVPLSLVSSTIAAAAQMTAGLAAAGGDPLPAVALAEGMVHAMFVSKVKMAAAVLLIVGALGLGAGYLLLPEAQAEKPAPAKADPPPDSLALRFGQYYEPAKVKGQPRIPAYNLPLDTAKVANYKEVAARLRLAADEPSLTANGFVVLPGHDTHDIIAAYRDMKKREVPVFITADTLLHLYHVQFDETLKDIEEREFYPDIVALTETLLKELAAQKPGDDANFRAAQIKALNYLGIALKCLKPDAEIPDAVEMKQVDIVLEKMKKHEGFWPLPETAHQEWPLFRYAEDFSQYVPRGHYTRSEELKKYFVGMMWLGRLAFILKGDPSYGPFDQPALVSVPEANQQTIAAAMMTRLLTEATLPDRRKARDVWERIYVVTSFYVGLADDLGLEQYQAALKKVGGVALDVGALADDKKMLAFRAELSRFAPPKIYSGTGGQGTFNSEAGPEELVKALDKSAGFRLMGQRFIPDSYMMGKLVFPTVGEPTRKGMFTLVEADAGPIRGFPRGLDVMAVLGSKRAREIIRETGDDAYKHGRGRKGAGDSLSYDEALTALQNEYSGLSERDWNRNLYWAWLNCLKPLTMEYGKGYQTFQTTEAYRTKSLNTALASWAQLRHDTILYAKQSYTMDAPTSAPIMPKPVQGYVEPVPEFYARLLTLSRMTNRGLGEMKVLDGAAKARLTTFEKLLEKLLALSEKELANEELKEADYEFIRDFGSHLQGASIAPNAKRLAALEQSLQKAIKSNNQKMIEDIYQRIADEKDGAMRTTLIADVHTDQNSKSVLEEGTGYVDLGVFVYQQPDGRLVAGAGPVLSYYEFKHPMKDRLTDEKWREQLKGGKIRQPEWTKAYLSEAGKYQSNLHD